MSSSREVVYAQEHEERGGKHNSNNNDVKRNKKSKTKINNTPCADRKQRFVSEKRP